MSGRRAVPPLAVLGAARVAGVGGAEGMDVLVDGGRIAAVGRHLEPTAGSVRLDAHGLVLAPGYVDLQVNGANGIDLAGEPERLWEVGTALARHGCTGFLPTIVSSPEVTIERAVAALTRRPPGYRGAEALGLHLEGPFLAPARRGAHPARFLRPPTVEAVQGWRRDQGVAMVTLAPELPGALEVVARLVAAGVVVAAGHTDADLEQLDAGIRAGVSYLTHLYNAMPPLAHRAPGPVGRALAGTGLVAGLVADGIHVHPVVVAATFAALGPARLNLVSDAVAALGRPPGRHRLGDTEVVLGHDGVRLADGTLAGASVGLDQAVRNLREWTGCAVADAVATVTATPARLLGLATKGAVAPGYDADLVLLDPDLHVVATVVAGRVVHDRRTT